MRAVHFALTTKPGAAERNDWPVTIHRSVFLGDLTQVHVTWGDRELVVRQSGMQDWTEGQAA